MPQEICKVSNCLKNLPGNRTGEVLCSKHNTTNVREVVEFSTWFNDKCATIIDGNYRIWLTIHNPKVGNKKESLFKESYWSDNTLSGAQNKARQIREKLQDNSFYANPLSSIYPNAEGYINWWGPLYPFDRLEGILDTFLVRSYFSNASDPDNYVEPLDVLGIKRGLYTHFVIYLGNGWVCNYNRENGAFLDTWYGFVNGKGGSSLSSSYSYGGSDASITRFHPIIPFKSQERIIEHIARSVLDKIGKYGSGVHEYCLANRNCEHFAFSCVLGIDYSYQAHQNSSEVKRYCPSKYCCSNSSANNGKSLSICIGDELRKTNEKLDNLSRYRSSSVINDEKEKIKKYIQESRAKNYRLENEELIMRLIVNSDWKKINNGW